MTGPEHYREAERLATAYKDAITAAEKLPDDSPRQADVRAMACENARSLLAKAQVHATLAQAAAIAEEHVRTYVGDESRGPREWIQAIS